AKADEHTAKEANHGSTCKAVKSSASSLTGPARSCKKSLQYWPDSCRPVLADPPAHDYPSQKPCRQKDCNSLRYLLARRLTPYLDCFAKCWITIGNRVQREHQNGGENAGEDQ